jgi:hypothetical protein
MKAEDDNFVRKQKAVITMTPLQASATVLNLLLASGPFAYPAAFVALGPLYSTMLLVITALVSYMASTFVIEAIQVV